MPEFVSDKKLYLNADKTKVVEEGDPDAAFVLVGEGGTVSHEDAERYGLSAPSEQPTVTRSAAEHEQTVAEEQRFDGAPGTAVAIDDDVARQIREGKTQAEIVAGADDDADDGKAKSRRASAENKAVKGPTEDK